MSEQFVVITRPKSEDLVELPTNPDDYSLSVNTLECAFSYAKSLKYKNFTTGAFQTLLLDETGTKFLPPADGWEGKVFTIVTQNYTQELRDIRECEKYFQEHKEEKWFRLKYHPEESQKRLNVFNQFLRTGRIEKVSLDFLNAANVIRLMDAVNVMSKGVTNNEIDDEESRDESDIEEDELDIEAEELKKDLDKVESGNSDAFIIRRSKKNGRVRAVNGVTLCRAVAHNDICQAAKLIALYDHKARLFVDNDAIYDSLENLERAVIESNNPILEDAILYLLKLHAEEESYNLNTLPVSDATYPLEIDEKLLAVLDKYLLYLRIVHSVDYYNCSEYVNENSTSNRLIHVRGKKPNNTDPYVIVSAEKIFLKKKFVDDYIKAHNQRLLSTLLLEMPSEEVLKKLGKRDAKEAVQEFIDENIVKLAKNKWLCRLCDEKHHKCDRLLNHVQDKHNGELDEVHNKVLFYNNFLVNSQRQRNPDSSILSSQSISHSSCSTTVVTSRKEETLDIPKLFFKGQTLLHIAARKDMLDLAELLIEKGADINIRSQNFYSATPLQVAVKYENLNLAKFLIDKGAKVNDIDNHTHGSKSTRGTLLHWAARGYNGEYDDVIRFLVENGADVNATEYDGRTPLCLLVKHEGSLDMIRFLVEKGTNLNNNRGYTPLYWAFYTDFYGTKPEVANLLIELGTNVNSYFDYSYNYYLRLNAPLHIVRNLFTAKLLIEKGAQINIINHNGNTPLHLVRDLSIAKLLVENGANVNAVNKYGNTPLHNVQSLPIAKLLVENGANVNAINHERYTPLHRALNVSIAEFFIEQGVDFKTATKDGKTVLHTIAETCEFDDSIFKDVKWLVDFFVRKGMDVNVTDSYGNTPLHLCRRSPGVAERLLENGANINAINNCNEKPGDDHNFFLIYFGFKNYNKLFVAVKDGRELCDIITLILPRKPVIINCVDDSGLSLLHYAVQKCQSDVIKFLLSVKNNSSNRSVLERHNINHRSGDHWTPLHYAAQRNDLEIVKILLENGAAYNVETIQGNTPLELTSNNAIKDIFILIKKLFEAVKAGDYEKVVQCIKEEKAVINAVESDGSSCLYWAISKGYQNIATFLLENDADETQITNKGSTLLHIAADKNDQTIVEALLKHANKDFVNTQLTNGTTALHIAAKNGFYEIVKCLLKYGAAYNIENHNGEKPFDLSTNQDATNLLNLIQKLFETARRGNISNKLQIIDIDVFLAVTNACDNMQDKLTNILKRKFLTMDRLIESSHLHFSITEEKTEEIVYDPDFGIFQ